MADKFFLGASLGGRVSRTTSYIRCRCYPDDFFSEFKHDLHTEAALFGARWSFMALHQILRDHHNSTQSQPGGKSKVLSQARLGELLALDAHGSNADGDNQDQEAAALKYASRGDDVWNSRSIPASHLERRLLSKA
ncbi:hypothetical protein DTO271G3_1548 [Paecilomyces variotii]|nr:hypothetical protein DTO271G3_1548 [Paecilomyces variotii]